MWVEVGIVESPYFGRRLVRDKAHIPASTTCPNTGFFYMREGYVKIYRKLWDNPWFCRPAYLAVWMWVLCEAQWQEGNSVVIKGKRIPLKPGQLTCGAKRISKATGVPRGTVERILETFKNEEQISIEPNNKFTLITVKKWGDYQKDDRTNEELVRNKRGTNEELVRTSEECKKERNKEKDNDYVIEDKPEFGNEDINWLLKEFETQMKFPSKGRKIQDRRMATHLLREFDRNQISYMLKYCSTDEYAPRVGSVEKLWYKRGDIIAALKAKKSKTDKSSIAFIS